MNRKYIYLATLLLLIFTSCKDFLKVDSPSKFDLEYVFGTETDMLKGLAGVYTQMSEDPLYAHYLNSAFQPNTDVEFKGADTPAKTDGTSFQSYEPNSYATSLQQTWERFYSALNRANICVTGIEASELYKTAIKEKTVNNVTQMYGEAKTLRAMLYFDLTRLFGDVPFLTKPVVAGDNFYAPAVDRNEILDFLIKDLEGCVPLMKYHDEITNGLERCNKEYAQGLIARMALNRGGWALYPDKNDPSSTGYMYRASDWKDYYEIARTYTDAVINEARHDLKSSFRDVWVNECNSTVPENDDVMFDISNISCEFAYSIGITMAAGGDNVYGSASGSNMNLAFSYMASFDPQDLRRDMTCALYAYSNTLNQVYVVNGSRYNSSVKAAKWSKMYKKTPGGASNTKMTFVNTTIMRFADILLMNAEVVNELDGPNNQAKEALKRVRRRAFDPANWGVMVDGYVDNLSTKEDFFKAIVDERKWEFGGENTRKYDLARWNLYGKTVYDMYHLIYGVGLIYNGMGSTEYDYFPYEIYYRSVADPNRSGKTNLEFAGINPKLPLPPSIEWSKYEFAKNLGAIDKVTGLYVLNDPCKNAFRNFINADNMSTLDPNNLPPVRYLLPIPNSAIIEYKGVLKNYYGFR